VAGLLDEQQPSRLVDRQQRDRRQQQQLVPDDGPQPGDMRSDTHVRNPTDEWRYRFARRGSSRDAQVMLAIVAPARTTVSSHSVVLVPISRPRRASTS
jgi:hypothetical protein